MVADVAHYFGLGGGGQAEHRSRRFIARGFLDEAADIAVVGPEIVAPFRHAMRLVQHPEPDLTLRQNRADRVAAQLLGRDQKHRRLSHAHTVQRILPLGHREHSIDGDGRGNSCPRHALHLIGHQRDQRRDHHGQRPGLVELRQGGDLVADRFAGAGRQDAEDARPAHRLIDDPLLQGAAHIVHRLRAEGIKPEPARQRADRVVLLAAPSAIRAFAIGVAQVPHDQCSLAELRPHPGRHDGIPARDQDPGQSIGHGPAELRARKAAQRLLDPPLAGAPRQQPGNRFPRRRRIGRRSSPNLLEHRVEPA